MRTGGSVCEGASVLKQFVCAVTVLAVGLGVAMAEEFTANVTKVAATNAAVW